MKDFLIASYTNRRRRTTFSPSQLRVLEDVFSRQQYLVGNERLRLASILNIGVTQVKVWFQNRRIRWRREQREMLVATRYETTTTSTSSTVPSSTLTPGVTLPEDLIMPTSALSEMRSAGDN
ncbi:hypothetical protein KIN20_011196 [Parelaphostrongylus tenuis]|uniref:Homeobox domain-containing protein n=1 Tax=Parelaphostrongylus tenuis TaxID=148309 RepID=A0AAD5MTB8_PARTN|nr:hypothetical protein KIN20_011196 [Parelaphostrongylus tenuis]